VQIGDWLRRFKDVSSQTQ